MQVLLDRDGNDLGWQLSNHGFLDWLAANIANSCPNGQILRNYAN